MAETEHGVVQSNQKSFEEKNEEIHQKAYHLFSSGVDWVTYFREVLGVQGVVRRYYPSREEMTEFERTETYATIQQMLTRLRERIVDGNSKSREATAVITVRLPKSMHEALQDEAFLHKTSINKLCISKLLQFIDKEYVPELRRETPDKSEEPGVDL